MAWHVITGGAGFIGVNLARALLARGDHVLAIDDLSLGRREHLAALASDRLVFRRADVADAAQLGAALDAVPGAAEIWHLCANSDIQKGSADPDVDLRATFLSTYAVLGAMRQRGWRTLHFASTSAVYGDHGTQPVAETSRTEPISNYGAMKLASEAILRAAHELFLPTVRVFRFPNVVGVPSTHGVILDFTRRLLAEPAHLAVLGNGRQQKAYLHVTELVEAMLFIRAQAPAPHATYNIGPADDGVAVSAIAGLVRDRVAPAATIGYGDEVRGWVGDVPRFAYDIAHLAALGWSPSLSSAAAVARAVDEVARQEGAPACRP